MKKLRNDIQSKYCYAYAKVVADKLSTWALYIDKKATDYQILRVEDGTKDKDIITKAYKKMAKRYHPDKYSKIDKRHIETLNTIFLKMAEAKERLIKDIEKDENDKNSNYSKKENKKTEYTKEGTGQSQREGFTNKSSLIDCFAGSKLFQEDDKTDEDEDGKEQEYANKCSKDVPNTVYGKDQERSRFKELQNKCPKDVTKTTFSDSQVVADEDNGTCCE